MIGIPADFPDTGAARFKNCFAPQDWKAIIDRLPPSAGLRLRDIAGLGDLIGAGSAPQAIASQCLGKMAHPVRAIMFNKSQVHNWPLDWHQDRTIAVAKRQETPGFGIWTVKRGIAHVEPPFDLLERMITVRLHLDDVDADNAPLRVAPGSHRLGLIREPDYSNVVSRCGELVCHANAGDIWAYATPILHASDSARIPRNRRVVQVDYSSDALPKPLEWAGI